MEPIRLPDFPDDTDIRIAHGAPFIFHGPHSVSINTEFFAAKMAKELHLAYFDKDEEWFENRDGCWVPVAERKLKEMIRATLNEEIRRSDVYAFDKIAKAVFPTMDSLKSKCYRGLGVPKLNPDIIPVKNGILEWKESENKLVFREYRPDDMVFNTLNVSYDQNAKSELFDRVIHEILHRQDNYLVVQDYFGGGLFMENRSRRFLVLQGASGSGKTTLSDMFASILGPSRMICPSSDKINDKFAFSSMKSQSLILIPEATAKTFETPEGCAFLKRACGFDPMAMPKKHKDETSNHSGLFTIVIMTNTELRFYSDEEGVEISDRLTPIVFDRKIENRDLQIEKKLQGENERSAILNWLIKGAERLIRNNLEIKLSEDQTKICNRMVKATKGVELFVRDHVEKSSGDHFLTSEACEAYARLVEKEGLEPLTREKFAKDLSTTMQKKYGVEIDHNLPAKKTPLMMGGATPKKQTARGYKGFRLVH
jgi:phage/plasmid-associated DNA primase